MLFNLAEQLDLATERSAKRTELRTLSEAWSTEVDADRRKLGIVRKMPKSPTPAKAKATSVR